MEEKKESQTRTDRDRGANPRKGGSEAEALLPPKVDDPTLRTARPPRFHDGGRGGSRGRQMGQVYPVRGLPAAIRQQGGVSAGTATTATRRSASNGVDAVRFVPLGGLEEIGRNMMFFEYKDEIIIIDMGFQFPEEATPGVDWIIPNVTYLESKKQNVKAVLLTHAHLDHIGAVPYLIGKVGNPTIYTTALTKAVIEKRQAEFPNAPRLKIQVVKNWDSFKLSKYFEAQFFGVAHTVPDTTGVVLKTPVGNMVHFADFRIDYDAEGNPQGEGEFAKVGRMGVHTLLIDSTNADEEGISLSEKIVEKNLELLFNKAEGRIIVGIISTMVMRIGEIIKIAEKLGRRVTILGRSIKDNVQIAQNLGYIKPKKDTIIPAEELHKYRDNKVLMLVAGAQGESNASLAKIANGENRFVKLKTGDTVAFSSSIIPGNERSVQAIKDNIARQGAVIYHSKTMDIHSSGHAPKEDLKLVMRLIKPKFVIPIHGYYFMRAVNTQNAQEAGIPKENALLMDNGQVALMTKENLKLTPESVPAFYVMVDGLGVGDVSEVVLRDRMVLAEEGMVVVIVTLDHKNGRVIKNPDIISRGFIYLKENQEMLEEMRRRIRMILSRVSPKEQEVMTDYVKNLLRDQIGQYLFNKTHRRPMILPVVIEV
ncbi:MAG: ribonuclease J [bacterium]|nr:ribonuclease J [bacterium]